MSGHGPSDPRLGQLFGARLATLLPDFLDAAAANALRQRLERAGYARYGRIDRGSYEHRAIELEREEPALYSQLLAAAAKATGRALALRDARALRLAAGDYLLTHHDDDGDADEGRDDDGLVELMLDLSPAATPAAEAYYRRHGRAFFAVPSQPRVLSIVERDTAVRVNHAYVSKRFPAAQVVRLVVRLGPIP